MSHSIVLDVPESIYQPLVAEATARGQKVEEIALEKLAKKEPSEISDPLDKFVGAFKTSLPDWTNNHDKYLGEDLAKDLRFKE